RGERAFLAAPVTIGGTPSSRGVLIVSESLKPYEATRTEVLVGLILLGLLVTAGATGIAAWTVSRTLDPVGSMADLADDWSAQQLDARFDEQTNDDEIAHLGRTLNVLLDRVAGALRSEQRLTSELAHELRTPLTAIRGEAELAQMAGPDDATRERLDRVVALTDRMSGTITTLLDLARGDHALDGRSTTPADVVDAAVEGRPESAVEVVVAGAPEDDRVRVAATTDIAVRALSPLLDNAVKHARSRVDVSWSVSARAATFTVSDDGPGVPDGDPDDLFAAGVRRGDEAGAGLGLSLARRAARSLGGEVHLVSHQEPTTFSLTLPLA
ncbi:MAG: hypothetical protein JWO46_172, partial [Nocardioidaceae bacterium]|nr:hypothetical protein [Nocardioidaceae bacterium]